MKESNPSLRKAKIANCFKQIPLIDNQEHVLILSSLWKIAMAHPNDPEFPSLGIFRCMATLINRGINDKDWLNKDQNIYIPYYAAHIIGSYTMNKPEFAIKAVKSGVIPPLIELLRGKISWVEQRVAVRALGHLASYDASFHSVAEHEEEVVNLAMEIASTCLEVVYVEFVGAKDKKSRLKYQRDLLTRGVEGVEMENRKAEEWASQLQCWSLYLLNCFASKEKSVNLICRQNFLKDLSEMWGGFVNHSSPAGVGLIRILCYSKIGRKSISELKGVILSLGNLSRSSDDWQYMGIDCLLLLLRDPNTRYKIIEIAAIFLMDLIESRRIGGRSNVGETIIRTLLLDYKITKSKIKDVRVERALEEIWGFGERRKREKMMSEEQLHEKKVLASLLKQQGKQSFLSGEVEEALIKYTEALEICPLKLRKERTVIYSNRAQCSLLLSDSDSAIRDATRALCLSGNSHVKSFWRRSQAYDMKGLAKESLTDCVMFINGCIKSESRKRIKVPYYAARMISKQMEATWLFAAARSKTINVLLHNKVKESDGREKIWNEERQYDDMMRIMKEKKEMTTIIEEPLIQKCDGRRKLRSSRRGKV